MKDKNTECSGLCESVCAEIGKLSCYGGMNGSTLYHSLAYSDKTYNPVLSLCEAHMNNDSKGPNSYFT